MFQPAIVKLVGYCEDCGLPIYPNDYLRTEWITENNQKEQIGIYRCIICKKEVKDIDLIPF